MKTQDEHRWNMVQLAIKNNDKFIADDYEMRQEAWNINTYETLTHFKSKYENDEIYFIMGADLLIDIGNGEWEKSESLISENKFIVMARDGVNMLQAISKSAVLRNNDNGSTFHLLDKGLSMEISSSYIREEFAMNGEPRYLLPESCYAYIKEHSLYANKQ